MEFETMKLHLAGCEGFPELVEELKPRFVLGSFFYMYGKRNPAIIPDCEHYILDSGAYSIQLGKVVDWDKYLDSYIELIKSSSNVHQYVELDIDSVVGLSQVEQWRDKLEAETGREPIPVWHKAMGDDGWINLVNSYQYVGIPCKNPKEKLDENYWNRFIRLAHENNVKVHGFGVSANEKILRYDFDSIDSSSWAGGCRFGVRYRFTGDSIQLYREDGYLEGGAPDVKEMNRTNMIEWIKFQNWIYQTKTTPKKHHGFW